MTSFFRPEIVDRIIEQFKSGSDKIVMERIEIIDKNLAMKLTFGSESMLLSAKLLYKFS